MCSSAGSASFVHPSQSSVSRYVTRGVEKSRNVPKLHEDSSFVSMKGVNGKVTTSSRDGDVLYNGRLYLP